MNVLLSNVVEVAKSKCATMVRQVEGVRDLFHPLFTNFSKCHSIYNGNVVDQESIHQLGGLQHAHK